MTDCTLITTRNELTWNSKDFGRIGDQLRTDGAAGVGQKRGDEMIWIRTTMAVSSCCCKSYLERYGASLCPAVGH